MEEQDIQPVRRRRWLRRTLAILLVLLIAALAAVWLMRVRLASDYIDRELARRGVQASYDVKRIGFGTQVFENLVIGDPRRPDLTAREVRIQILIGFTGPRVGLISARGVRMIGRVRDGRLSLGQIDRLLPPPSGLPFRLPDQRIDVADAAIALDTPAGWLAVSLQGRGNLSDGFRGQMAMVSRSLRLGECAIVRPVANVAVGVDDLRPSFRGPLAIESLSCGDDLAVERPLFALDAALSPGIDSWRGETAIRAARLAAGSNTMAALQGRLSFVGNAERTGGEVALESAAAAVDPFRAARTRFAGRYAVSPRHGDVGLNGDLAVQGLTLANADLAGIARALRSAEGTPVGPAGAVLADAVTRAGRGGANASGRVELANRGGNGAIRFDRLRVETRSGARLAGERLSYRWPSGALQIEGDLVLTGGGFPDTRVALDNSGTSLRGIARIAPIRAGNSRMALSEVRFAVGRDGTTAFQTALALDGPFSGGRVTGLTLPLRGRFGPGGMAIGEGCVTASFRALRYQSLDLGPTRLPLCPTGPALVWRSRGGVQAGAELRGPRFAGRLGQSPLQLASQRLRFSLERFEASGLAVRLGPAAAPNRLDVERLEGRFGRGGMIGSFGGLAGKIANVPLLVSQGGGRWLLDGGELQIEAALRVADEQSPARFYPLASDDFRLRLADNRIHATGLLKHPDSGTRVARAAIEHDLGTGAGAARLEVEGLAFREGFQPEQFTPLTVGVVALVDGTLTGEGRIEWDARGSRSSGTFSTADMNLAAPFGPVEGLTTTIHFTDLLGLTSAPGQVARVDLIRAGIDVYDGQVRYQLQPNYHVAVEGGRWPFAGGELFLQPTMLDFSQESTKYLTFRVTGLDAASFIQQMEFSNIAATGTFDGIVPMQFDQSGGRIVDGRLTARDGGGTLSYVGELTDRDLGPYGILAFNALKSLRYSRFDITLNGALAGEFITIIDLDGVARDPSLTTLPSGGGIMQAVAGRVLRQVARIPFEFNIRIEGEFRSLIATARSFSDPTSLIQSALPTALRDAPTTETDVQDEESEPVQ